MKYNDYLQSDEWKKRRNWALLFWDHKCALCYSPERVEVHHRTYMRLGNELLTDLIVLCDTCHERHHEILPLVLSIDIDEFIKIGGEA